MKWKRNGENWPSCFISIITRRNSLKFRNWVYTLWAVGKRNVGLYQSSVTPGLHDAQTEFYETTLERPIIQSGYMTYTSH